MTETEQAAADALARDRQPAEQPAISREEAVRMLEQARRLRKLAEHVQSRRVLGSVDSAILAERSLSLLLGVVVRLHGEPIPTGFSELSDRASAIAASENLLAEEPREDLSIIAEMRRRLATESEVTPAEDRRYDRAFLRSAEWFGATRSYLDQRLPDRRSRLIDHATLAIAVLVAFGLGLVVGRQQSTRVGHSAVTAMPLASGSATGAAFVGTIFRDPLFGQQVLTRRDSAIAFDWADKAPIESMAADGFSIRWDGNLAVASAGKYVFYLTSDDGSRLFIDGGLVLDNWGSHSAHTEEATIELAQGVHQIRVEYFDKLGLAMVRLEWSSDEFIRRLVTSADLR